MRRSHAVLATVGLAALITYIMACRPAFSPDGSKILFSYVGVGSDARAIGLFDRTDGTSRCLLSAFGPTIVTAQWTPDGKSALILLPEQKGLDDLGLVLLPLDRSEPVRTYFVRDVKKSKASVVIPPPVIGRHVFLGGKSLVRLDLTTGEIERAEFDAEIFPILQGDRLYYIGETGRPGVDYDFGTLHPETLAPKPILEFRKKDTGEVTPFIAVSRDGTRVAIAGRHEKHGRILIFEGKKLARFLNLATKTGSSTIGNVVMAAGDRTVYASFLREIESESSVVFGVLEASVAGDAAREIPLFRLRVENGELDNDFPPFLFQIALSPDGTTLAAFSGLFVSGLFAVKPEDRALFLVDLKDPDRKVTRIPIPRPEKAPGKPARK